MRGLLVGYGSIGRRHLANLHELGVTDWAVVRSGHGTLPLEPPCPVRIYLDLDEALDCEKPIFAVVANPTSLHLSTALACVNAGCHVLLEKPVSHSSAGLDELSAAAAGNQRRILVGFQFRFHPALRRVAALLHEQALGRPLYARVIWGEYLPSWHPWEDYRLGYAARYDLGGGVHHTISHPLDYLRMLFGDATVVSASLTECGPLGLAVAESADVLVHFDGVGVQVHLDYWRRPPAHRMEVVCTEGTIEWDYISGEFKLWEGTMESCSKELYPGLAARNDLFRAEARHFLDVIESNSEPVCTLADGIEAARLSIAIEQCPAVSTSSKRLVEP